MAELPAVNKEDLDQQTATLKDALGNQEDLLDTSNNLSKHIAEVMQDIRGFTFAMLSMDKKALKRAMAQKGFDLEKFREGQRGGKPEDDKGGKGKGLASFSKSNFSKYAGLLGLAVAAYFTGLDKYIRAILLPKGIKLVSGIFKGIAKTLAIPFKKPFTKAFAPVSTAWKNFTAGFKNVGKTIGAVKTPVAVKEFSTLSGKIGAVFGKIIGPQSLIMRGLKWVGGIFSSMSKFFSGIVTFIKTGFGKIMAPITKGIKWIMGIFSSIGKFFGGLGPIAKSGTKLLTLLKGIPVLGWVITIIFGIFDFISGFIKGFSSEGAEDERSILEKLWDGMTGGIIKAIKGIIFIPLDLITKGVAYLLGFLGFDQVEKKILAWVGSGGFTGMFDKMVKSIGEAIDTILDWFNKLFEDPIGTIWSLVGAYLGMLLDFGGWIWDHTLGPVVDWFGTLFGAKKGETKAAIDKKLGTWRTAFEDFGTWIYNKIILPIVNFFTTLFKGDVKAAFKNLWDAHVSAIADFGNWIYNKAIKPIINFFGTLFGGKEGEAVTAFETKFGIYLTAIKDFGSWLYDKAIKPIITWFGTLFKDPAVAIKQLWTDFVTPYVNFGKWIYSKAIKPIITWFDTLFSGDAVAAIKESWKKFVTPYVDFGKWIYSKAIEPVINWFKKLFGSDKKEGEGGKKPPSLLEKAKILLKPLLNFADWIYNKTIRPVVEWFKKIFGGEKEGKGDKPKGKTLAQHVGTKLDALFNLPMTIYDKYIKPVVKWISDLFGGDADKPEKMVMKLPDLSAMMPDLPTWSNIKIKIGEFLNMLFQKLAQMTDTSFFSTISNAFADAGIWTAKMLGVGTAMKYSSSAKKGTGYTRDSQRVTVDTSSGKVLTRDEVLARRVEAENLATKKREAGTSMFVDSSKKVGDTLSSTVSNQTILLPKVAADSSAGQGSAVGANTE